MLSSAFVLELSQMPYLAIFGLIIGAMGGFFGVGGGFLMVPLLNAVFGIPYNVAVGSDLGQMTGMATAATVDETKGFAASVRSGLQIGNAEAAITMLGAKLRLTLVMGLVYAIRPRDS
jgi:uncharacterized membrane protein YfcA